MLRRSGYLDELEESTDPQDEGRVENLQELVSVAREYTERVELGRAAGQAEEETGEAADGARRPSLAGFLEQVALVADADQMPSDDPDHAGVVTLMTLHTAKGLEFPVVFLTGLEDGVFPHLRSLGDRRELEEERRLAYVGITRARQRLYLSRAVTRSAWGAAVVQPAVPVPGGGPARRDPLGADRGGVHELVGQRSGSAAAAASDRARRRVTRSSAARPKAAAARLEARPGPVPADHRQRAAQATCRTSSRATGSTTSAGAWAGSWPSKVTASARQAQIDFGDQIMWIVLRHAPIEKI